MRLQMLRWLVAHTVSRQRHCFRPLWLSWRCDSKAERALIPAFIFFFQMLYLVFLGIVRSTRDNRGDRPPPPGGVCCGVPKPCRTSAESKRSADALIDGLAALAHKLQSQGTIDLARIAEAIVVAIANPASYPGWSDMAQMVSALGLCRNLDIRRCLTPRRRLGFGAHLCGFHPSRRWPDRDMRRCSGSARGQSCRSLFVPTLRI